MKRLITIKEQLDLIKDSDLIKALFTTSSINNDNLSNIDLYLLIREEQFQKVYSFVNNLFKDYNYLIHSDTKKVDNHFITRLYYENCLNINLFFLFDLDLKLYEDVVILNDPYNLIVDIDISQLTLTNIEFANLIDEYSSVLYEYYNSILLNDKLLSYKYALKLQEIFVLIYRGFYDSMNAKKEYKSINKTMNSSFCNVLTNIIKLFRYDSFSEGIRHTIIEIDKIINELPINIITLFNVDFYNFSKKLIFNL